MKDLLLNTTTNNLTVTNHDLTFTSSNSEFVAQKLKLRLSIVKGEWFLNNQIGLPYFDEIFVKTPNLGRIEDLFKKEIKAVYGVEEILTFSFDYLNTTRLLTITFSVRITTGEIVAITI